MQEFGLQLLDALQSIRSPWLDQLMVFITQLGKAGLIWIVLTLVLLLRKRTRYAGCVCAVSLLLSLLFCNLLLKPLVARPRPYTYRELELLVPWLTDWSFPSGHASSSFAAAMGLTTLGWRWALPAFALAALIAFSRLYLYVHFPGDVLCGAALGLVCGLAARYVVAGVSHWYENRPLGQHKQQ